MTRYEDTMDYRLNKAILDARGANDHYRLTLALADAVVHLLVTNAASNTRASDADAEEDAISIARTVIDVILDSIQRDPHQWSARPCTTCQNISAIAGRAFGCVRKANEARDISASR